MKLDKGIMSLTTASGFCLTLLLGIIMLAFAAQRQYAMNTKRYIDIKKTATLHYWNEDYIFSQANGLEIAVAFSAFDDGSSLPLDKSIGELVFISYEWGSDPDTGKVFTKREKLPSYQCSKEELGIVESSESRFYPM